MSERWHVCKQLSIQSTSNVCGLCGPGQTSVWLACKGMMLLWITERPTVVTLHWDLPLSLFFFFAVFQILNSSMQIWVNTMLRAQSENKTGRGGGRWVGSWEEGVGVFVSHRTASEGEAAGEKEDEERAHLFLLLTISFSSGRPANSCNRGGEEKEGGRWSIAALSLEQVRAPKKNKKQMTSSCLCLGKKWTSFSPDKVLDTYRLSIQISCF